MSWIKKESKESWHTSKPSSKMWASEETREPWHKHKPGTKGWMKEESKEHDIKSLKKEVK